MVVSLMTDSAELLLLPFCMYNSFILEFYIIYSQINVQVVFFHVLKHSKNHILALGVNGCGEQS